jgi:hypothetical protein
VSNTISSKLVLHYWIDGIDMPFELLSWEKGEAEDD